MAAGSVMHYLMDALPLACVGYTLATQKNHKNRERAFLEASADELRTYMEFVPPGISKQVKPAEVDKAREAYDQHKRPRIWFHESGPHPDRVGVGAVRVKEMNLAAHVAFESIDWGTVLDPKRLASEIRVTANGRTFVLPLQNKFLYCQWWIEKSIWLPGLSGFDLFPLMNPLNVGLVRAFVYHRASNGEVLSLHEAPLTNAETTEWSETDAAMRKLRRGSVERDPKLGEKLFRHQALSARAPANTSGAAGGPDVRVRAIGDRFLVTISLFLGRDVYDFEPAGALDSARIYPHVHFASSIPCETVEAACHVRRPKSTRILAELGSEAPAGHAMCHEMHSETRNLLVTDTNDEDALVHLVPAEAGASHLALVGNFNPAPQWGNLFSYYLPDASDRMPGRAFKVVHAARPDQKMRTANMKIIREEPHLLVPLPRRDPYQFRRRRTTKLAQQGEFDNIHMAPRMFLNATMHASRHAATFSLARPRPGRPSIPTSSGFARSPWHHSAHMTAFTATGAGPTDLRAITSWGGTPKGPTAFRGRR